MNIMKRLLLIALLMIALPALSQTQEEPIPANQAFQFSATAKDYQTIVAMWTIKPGYYLYRDRIQISPANPGKDILAQPLLPATTLIKDYPGIGKLPVYKGNLKIAVPVIKSSGKTLIIKVHYQGCSEKGYCYPPQTKIVPINLAGNYMVPVQPVEIDLPPTEKTTTTTTTPTSEQDKIAQLLSQHNLFTILIGFFLFGLLLSLTPCVLPMIPILSGIIISKGPNISRAHAFGISCAYVLGMAITNTAAGIIFGFIGYSVQVIFQQPWIIVLYSLIFVAMALSLFGLYNIQIPQALQNKLTKINNHQKHGTYVGATIMGVLSFLILSPCVTPPLVGALAYISQSGNAALGGAALFVMSIGMGTPLLLIGAFSKNFLPKAGSWMNGIKYILGVLMLALAIWMISRILPGTVTMILWGILILGSSIALDTFKTATTTWKKIRKTIGILLFVYGLVLLIGAFIGNTNPLDPLNLPNKHVAHKESIFIPANTLKEAQQQLQLAKSQHQPVILDFYADWCIACKQMDLYTFSNPQVQKQLGKFRLLRADVTKNNMQTIELQKYFHVVAPPTILFFDPNGKEIKSSRIVGEMSASAFLKHLEIIMKRL